MINQEHDHEIQVFTVYFEKIKKLKKTWELVKNKEYKEGQIIKVSECDPETGLNTGKFRLFKIGFTYYGSQTNLVKEKYCIISLIPIKRERLSV
jgi:hypothetical protein